jgi:CBS domain containing-hemolysin-like protein
MWTWLTTILPGYNLLPTVLACGVLIFFYFGYSGCETGLYRLNRLRLHLACRHGNRRALILDKLFDQPQMLISVFVVGANLCGYLIAGMVTLYLSRSGFSAHETEFWTTLVLTPVFAIFCETLPKNCFYVQANRLMLKFAPFIRFSFLAMQYTGLTFLVGFFSRRVLRIAHRLGRSTAASGDWDDYGTMLREGLAAGELSVIQGGIAERLLQLPEIPLSRVIIPLSRTLVLPLSVSREEFLRQVQKKHYSRIPLYEGHPKNIVGLVSVYQVLAAEGSKPPMDFIRPVPKIAADQKLLTALNILRENSIRMAVVVDRSAKAMGIITLRDLLGEMFVDLE